MKRIHGRTSRVGYRRLRQTRATPKNAGAGEVDTAKGKAPGWWSRQRDDLLRDALVAFVCGLLCGAALLAAAVWFDNRRQDRAQDLANQQALRAEVLENTRFVRQAVMEPSGKLKPFARLNLHGASLASLPLGCTKVDVAASEGCADLRDANLTGADLRDADLTGANLRAADLYGAHLRGADLAGADMRGARLTANLAGANLAGADLVGANLTLANLRGADLRGAHLAGANLTDICYDVKTVWPERFEPPRGPEC